MAIPGQSLSIRDPGLGIVEPGPSIPLFLGCSSAGTVNTVYTFSNKGDAVTTLGQGPLVEAVCHALDIAGGPIRAMRLTGGTAASAGSVTKTAIGTSTGTVTVTAQVPYDAYEVIIEIMATGTVGVGKFRYSLDDGYTYSETLTIPSGGTYAIPNTNITATFVPGGGAVFFEDGDLHEFDCVAPLYTTTNLSSGITALLASSLECSFLVLTGKHVSAANANTMFAALDTHMTSLSNVFRYMRALMDAGNDTTANVLSGLTATSSRIAPVYGDTDITSGKPFAGWGTPKLPALVTVAARAAASLVSTDLARVPDGALPGVVAISHDEFRTETLDAHKVTTLRTWQGRGGFYVTNGRLKSAAGSDFLFWQHGRCMDVACDVTQKSQQMFSSTGVRTNADGTINERDAKQKEDVVNDALRTALLDPNNAEGSKGHVSALQYRIARDNNVQTSFEVKSKVAIRPLGYVKTITTELGYTLNVGG